MNNTLELNNELVSLRIRRKIYKITKRSFDILFGLIGIILLIPITIILKICYMLTGDFHKIIFTQERIGLNGKTFKFYKFRSMVWNADEVLFKLLKKNKKLAKEYKINKKLKKDPRITKIGKIIRKTSIDELPQMINIFKGEMSLIGNRPYLPREKDDMGEYFKDVVKTKPGLTGWWQVGGRSNSTFLERLKMEKYYSEHAGFKLDIKIFLKTFKVVLGMDGASSMKHIDLDNKTILVTGSSGFIGSNLCLRLLNDYKNIKVIGLDNMNDYYDVNLKEYRLSKLQKFDNFIFVKGNLQDKELINNLFKKYNFDIVVNLAAQAGVRYSITNPDSYIESNIIGFYNILECCRNYPVEHLVYASSSSVYGGNEKVPFATSDKVDNPVSLYAATKKSNELLAHSYSKLYNIPSTGLRFFTVYGPAGRPDMAYFGFTNKLIKGDKIEIFNYGNCKRDFTYIDDIVEGIVRVIKGAPDKKIGEDNLPIPPYNIYNIGNSNPENLLDFVNILQEELIRAGVLSSDYDFESHKELVPMQPGDVPVTYADTKPLEEDYGFKPNTSLRDGLRKFAEWYKEYYMK